MASDYIKHLKKWQALRLHFRPLLDFRYRLRSDMPRAPQAEAAILAWAEASLALDSEIAKAKQLLLDCSLDFNYLTFVALSISRDYAIPFDLSSFDLDRQKVKAVFVRCDTEPIPWYDELLAIVSGIENAEELFFALDYAKECFCNRRISLTNTRRYVESKYAQNAALKEALQALLSEHGLPPEQFDRQ